MTHGMGRLFLLVSIVALPCSLWLCFYILLVDYEFLKMSGTRTRFFILVLTHRKCLYTCVLNE